MYPYLPSAIYYRSCHSVQDLHLRNRRHKATVPLPNVGVLLSDFSPQIPGKYQDMIRPGITTVRIAE